jgi:hypothetical protein
MKNISRILTWLIVAYAIIILILSVVPTNFHKRVNLNGTWLSSDYVRHALLFIPWMVMIHWRWKEKKDAKFFLESVGSGIIFRSSFRGDLV